MQDLTAFLDKALEAHQPLEGASEASRRMLSSEMFTSGVGARTLEVKREANEWRLRHAGSEAWMTLPTIGVSIYEVRVLRELLREAKTK